ncbi:MAG: hypothetical protein KAV00_01555 [Phycisphaerae bacterium]|nr:hypothetical protein [Phycisphaerae bacterium]
MAYPTRTLRELSRVIFSRLLGIILILVIVVAGALTATFLGPWEYRSKAMLMADPKGITISPLETATTMRDRLSLFILKQRELITTEYVQASALMKLDGVSPASDEPTDLSGEHWYTDAQIAQFTAENYNRLADVRKRVKVTTPGGVDATFTQIFNIFVDWPEEKDLPGNGKTDSRTLATQRAQQFTKHLIDAYQFRRSSLEVKQAKESSIALMKETTADAKKNMDDAQEKLIEYITEKIGADISEAKSISSSGVGETGIQTQRTENQKKISTIDTRLAELKALIGQIDIELKKGPDKQVVIPEVLLTVDNLGVSKIIEAIADLRIKLNTLTPQFEDSYKEIKEARAELAANLADLKKELARQRTTLNMEIAGLGAQRTVLVKKVDDDKKKMIELGPKAMMYSLLDKNADDAQKMHSKQLEGYLEAKSAEMAAKIPNRVSVISGPSLPDISKPHRPILWANVLISIFAGLVLALVYAFMADHFDHTVKGIEDVERHIETNVLASVPKFTRKIIRTR